MGDAVAGGWERMKGWDGEEAERGGTVALVAWLAALYKGWLNELGRGGLGNNGIEMRGISLG